MLTASNDEAADICSTMSPKLVLKVASQTELAAMHAGGALVNNTTRLVDPVAGGQLGAMATFVNGWVVGVGNVVVVLDVVVVVGLLADFPAELFTRSTMPTMTAAKITAPIRTPRLAASLPALFDDGLLLFTSGSLPRPLLGWHGAEGYRTRRAGCIPVPLAGPGSVPRPTAKRAVQPDLAQDKSPTAVGGPVVAHAPGPAVGWLA